MFPNNAFKKSERIIKVFSYFTVNDTVTNFSFVNLFQVRAIRKKMVENITRDVVNSELKDVVNKLLPDSIAKDIEKACQGIYPLHDVYIRKVRI